MRALHFFRWLLMAASLCFGVPAWAATVIFLTTTGTNSWTVPSDWNSANNTIEAIGEGGVATAGFNPAGTGGAYAYISNFSGSPGSSVNYTIGAGGTGTDTVFQNTSTLVAKSGQNGGSASACVPTTGAYSGGARGAAGIGSGGGGAAGPNGAGQAGGTSAAIGGSGGGGANGGSATPGTNAQTAVGVNGGNGNGGTGGGSGGATTAGTSATPLSGGGGGGGSGQGGSYSGGNGASSAVTSGASGRSWTQTSDSSTAGPGGGGGGGGGFSGSTGTGGNGGQYGGGGGGSFNAAVGTAGQGIIVITYTPTTSSPNTNGNFFLMRRAMRDANDNAWRMSEVAYRGSN